MAFSPMRGLSVHTRKKKKTKDPRKLRNLGERKWNTQTSALYLFTPIKIEFYKYLVENSQKSTLNFLFKSIFSLKPSKFPMHFARDCRWMDRANRIVQLQLTGPNMAGPSAGKKYFIQTAEFLFSNFVLTLAS